MKGFARREFQLVLLRRMADYRPDLVEAAAAGLGSSRTEMREVNARWQRMVRSPGFPGGRRRLAAVLGPPLDEEVRRAGDVEATVARWPLTLWPGLLYEAVTGLNGIVLQEWLVRAEGVPVPEPPRAGGELEPWSYVVGDMDRLFDGVKHFAGEVPSRWHAEFSVNGTAYLAHFVWGLLQHVEPGQPR
ncbi:hypothetical protein [Spirillospora sp. NPDC029432]|uniref:hypothetical protein n=1 Tax=Spirillospora sp. NPDC029432 TaxID=3154599 RepID=UPI00345730F1